MKVSGDVVKPQAIEDKHFAYITTNGFYGTQWQSAGNQPGTKPLNHDDIPDYKTIVSQSSLTLKKGNSSIGTQA